MFIHVAVPVPALDLLTYAVPPGTPVPPVGARVVVPLGARVVMTVTKNDAGLLFWTVQAMGSVER